MSQFLFDSSSLEETLKSFSSTVHSVVSKSSWGFLFMFESKNGSRIWSGSGSVKNIFLAEGELEYDKETINDLMGVDAILRPPHDFPSLAKLLNDFAELLNLLSSKTIEGSTFLYLQKDCKTSQTEKARKCDAWFCGTGKLKSDFLSDGLLYSGEDELTYDMHSDKADRKLSNINDHELCSDQPHIADSILPMSSSLSELVPKTNGKQNKEKQSKTNQKQSKDKPRQPSPDKFDEDVDISADCVGLRNTSAFTAKLPFIDKAPQDDDSNMLLVEENQEENITNVTNVTNITNVTNVTNASENGTEKRERSKEEDEILRRQEKRQREREETAGREIERQKEEEAEEKRRQERQKEREEDRNEELRRKKEETEDLHQLKQLAEAALMSARPYVLVRDNTRKREASALPKNKAKQLKAGHRSPKAKADAKRLRLSNKSELVKIVKELNGGCFKSIDDAMTHFIEVLSEMKRDSATMKAKTKLCLTAKAMSRRFTGTDINKFLMWILRTGTISNDRVWTASHLSYFALGSGLIIDKLLEERIYWEALYSYLNGLSKAQILESLEELELLFDKSMIQIREEILQSSWATPEHLEGKVMENLFTEERIKRCIVNICRNFQLEFPVSYRSRFLGATLDQELEAYTRGEIEDEDFLHLFNVICKDVDNSEKEALDHVTNTAGSLGHYLREMKHPTVSSAGHRSINKPACLQPYNELLHQLGRECGETRLIETENDVNVLTWELQASQHITVLTHAPPKLFSRIEEIDLLTFRTKKKVFAVLPKVFPRIMKSIGMALREFAIEQTVFVHKGNKMRQFCKEAFEWEPENVIDVFQICQKKGWGVKDSMDRIAEEVVGGKFCRRAWRFDAATVPSSTVLEIRTRNGGGS